MSALLLSFDIDPLDQDTLGKLETWADAVVTRGDVTYAQILDEPRVDLSYDPSSDLLRVTSRDALARARPGPGSVVDDLPDLDQTLRPEAELVRAQLQPLLGPSDLFTSEFQVTTREIGYGGGEGLQPDPIAFEYTFTQHGEIEGLALPDHSLGIGLTRLGELSTLTVSRVEVEVTGAVGVQRTPQQALDALTAAIATQYPSALDPLGVEFVAPRVGYQLGEGETTRELVPSLLLGYVLAFGSADDPMVSRRVPVRVSLVSLDAPIESLAATDPNPHGGDDRGSN